MSLQKTLYACILIQLPLLLRQPVPKLQEYVPATSFGTESFEFMIGVSICPIMEQPAPDMIQRVATAHCHVLPTWNARAA